MNNCLLLLTNYYPFHKGEEYLETEIEYLAEKFKKIFVISTMVSNEMKQTRNVPENVQVISLGVKHDLVGKIKMVLRQYKKIRKNYEKKIMINQDAKGKILPKLYSYYFECRSMEVYNKIKIELEKYNLNQYDSISIYSYWFYITARVAVELKQNYFKDRYIYTISRAHGYDINEHVNMIKFLPEREFLLNYLDNVFPVSQNGVEFLKKKYPKYGHKVEIRRLGTKEIEIEKKHSNDKLYIVSCSTVRKLKRIDLLIKALQVLEERKIDYKWTHIGNGPEFENIKKLASTKLDKKNYEFTGYINNSEVLVWYKNNPSTVFVNTSFSEGVPVSIMEAMSIGLPIIATDVGGTREIVENGKNGYLLPRDCTIEQIVNSLINIKKTSEDNYRDMCRNSIEIWYERCSAKKLYTDFAEELANNTECETLFNLKR
ncbi:glycosyltransferase [Ureibacillus thermosphaericus]|uniref:glycosyltransferase n=1 Tax=Ureibacillus thermosphaericus TaxID=51173 RepID=UPI000BBCF19E|nr:glycosyltransferase [Ureibacillus thermosphaericus]